MSNIANMKEFINELNSGEIDIENDEDYLDNYTRLFLDDNSKNVYYGFVYNYFGDTVVINLDTGEIGYWNYDTNSLDKVISTNNTKTLDLETNHELTRTGNIGVTTSQQMIESEIKLWDWNFIDNVFKDIAEILTLPIYEVIL